MYNSTQPSTTIISVGKFEYTKEKVFVTKYDTIVNRDKLGWFYRIVRSLILKTKLINQVPVYEDHFTTKYTPIKPTNDLVKFVKDQIVSNLNEYRDASDLVCYCSPDFYNDLAYQVRSCMHVAPIEIMVGQYNKRYIFNVPVMIVPSINGAIVVPKFKNDLKIGINKDIRVFQNE